jgi:hypothetical protein
MFRDLTMNLALPLWIFNEPTPPNVFKDSDHDTMMNGPIKVADKGIYYIYLEFTKWDKIDIIGPLTVG